MTTSVSGSLYTADGSHFVVPLDRLPEINAHRWKRMKNGYAARNSSVAGLPPTIYLHRWLCGASGKLVVHHCNGDKWDNRLENLQIMPTRAQHTRHHRVGTHWAPSSGCRRNNRSGIKGVSFHAPTGKWRAAINPPQSGPYEVSKQIWIGSYATPEAAGRAYDAWALAVIGPDAYLNFPE